MKIIECFKSIQGEGINQGTNSLFIRFPSCNLSCENCDSNYALKGNIKDISDVKLKKLIKDSVNIVFTGGEPLLKNNYQKILEIFSWFPYVENLNKFYEIETNGTQIIDSVTLKNLKTYRNTVFNISPKGNFQQEKIHNTDPIFIQQCHQQGLNYIVKFLFYDDKDFNYVRELQKKYFIPDALVYMQPVGVMGAEILDRLRDHFKIIINNGWNISGRLHCLLFDNERGV